MFQISSGRDTSKGIKTVIYGVEGIGKTTLASHWPDPVFIDVEGSTSHFDNIRRLQAPTCWAELQNQVRWLGEEKPCKTVVIDTLDKAEAMEVEALLRDEGWLSIETPGYGKGYTASKEKIQEFLDLLDKHLISKGIHVVLTCHAKVRKFELPEERGAYDRYELKLGQKTGSQTAPLVKEWADMVLFCNYKTYVEIESAGMGQTKGKAVGGADRMMYATHNSVWDAKNRFGLPDEMTMEYKHLEKIFAGQTAAPKEQKKEEPKPATEPEVKADDPMPALVDEPIGAVDWPDVVPQDVKDLMKKESYHPDDVQKMIYREGIVSKPDYPLDKVPAKFWTSLVRDYHTRWAQKMYEARQDNLPF